MTSPSEHFVQTPSGRLFARAWARRPPVREPIVLIHDSLGSVELWRDFPARLAETTGRTVIAYDRLGFGRSDPRSDRLSTAFVHQEAETYVPCVLRHFQIERFVPFGHSVGGAMAVCCGAVLSDACAAIVTESAQTFAEELTLRSVAEARGEYANSDRFARLARYHGDKARWVLHAWLDTWLSPEFATWNLDRELAQLRSPLLAMHGDRDEFGSLAHLDRARSCSPVPVTTRIFEGRGHVPHRESPEAVAATVAAFLESSTRSRA